MVVNFIDRNNAGEEHERLTVVGRNVGVSGIALLLLLPTFPVIALIIRMGFPASGPLFADTHGGPGESLPVLEAAINIR